MKVTNINLRISLYINIFYYYSDLAHTFTNGPLRKLKMVKVANSSTTFFDVYTWADNESYVCDGDLGGAVQIEFFSGTNIVIGIAKVGNTANSSSQETA